MYSTNSSNNGVTFTIFAVLTVIFNFGVLLTILSNRNLRNRGPYILIAVISGTQFLQGIFPYSFYSYIYFFPVVDNLCSTLVAVQVTMYVCESIVVYNLLLLFISHLQQKRNQNESFEKQFCVIGSIATIVLSVIIFPSVLVTQSQNKCYFSFHRSTAIALQCIVFFVPAFLLCVAGIITVISHGMSSGRTVTAQGEMQRHHSFPSNIVIASFLFVVTTAPATLIIVLQFSCIGSYCSWYFDLVQGLSFFSLSSVFIIPFAWILDYDYRAALKGLFVRQTSSTNPNSPMTVYYNQPQVKMFANQPNWPQNQYTGAYATSPQVNQQYVGAYGADPQVPHQYTGPYDTTQQIPPKM